MPISSRQSVVAPLYSWRYSGGLEPCPSHPGSQQFHPCTAGDTQEGWSHAHLIQVVSSSTPVQLEIVRRAGAMPCPPHPGSQQFHPCTAGDTQQGCSHAHLIQVVSSCPPVQLEILRRAGAMPISSRQSVVPPLYSWRYSVGLKPCPSHPGSQQLPPCTAGDTQEGRSHAHLIQVVSSCTPVQLEILRRAETMPIASRQSVVAHLYCWRYSGGLESCPSHPGSQQLHTCTAGDTQEGRSHAHCPIHPGSQQLYTCTAGDTQEGRSHAHLIQVVSSCTPLQLEILRRARAMPI